MAIWDVLWTIYLIVAGPAVILTYREQIRNGHRILAYRVVGLMACIVWPLVFPIIFLSAQSRRA